MYVCVWGGERASVSERVPVRIRKRLDQRKWRRDAEGFGNIVASSE